MAEVLDGSIRIAVLARNLLFDDYMIGSIVAVVAIPLLLSRRRWLVAEKLLFAVVVGLLLISYTVRVGRGLYISWDFRTFHRAGTLALAGSNPYAVQPDVAPFMNPPTSLPLVKLFGLASLPAASRIWTAVNALLLLVSPYLAWKALASSGQGSDDRAGSFPWVAASCLYLSTAALWGIDAGQLCNLVAMMLLAGVWLRNRRRPGCAGIALSIATLKVGTLIPVLTQFLGRRDRAFWLGLLASGLLLGVLGSPLSAWPDQCRANVSMIRESQKHGEINDYSFDGLYHDDIISISRWLYCLGLREHTVIAGLEFLMLAAVGGWLTWETVSGRTAPDATLALAFVFGCFFLYHRLYDTVALAPAMIYCSEMARRESGWRRASFGLVVVGLMAVINMPRGEAFRDLAAWSVHAGLAGRIVQVLVLPYVIWVLFGSMAVIRLGAPPLQSAGPSQPAR